MNLVLMMNKNDYEFKIVYKLDVLILISDFVMSKI